MFLRNVVTRRSINFISCANWRLSKWDWHSHLERPDWKKFIWYFNSVFFFLLSSNRLIGWQLSIWNCCTPFFSLLYNCQLLCFWRLVLSTVVFNRVCCTYCGIYIDCLFDVIVTAHLLAPGTFQLGSSSSGEYRIPSLRMYCNNGCYLSKNCGITPNRTSAPPSGGAFWNFVLVVIYKCDTRGP